MMLLQRPTGKINWAASQTRPDLSYWMLELSTKFKSGKLHNLTKAKKAIDRLINNPVKLLLPKITGKLSLVTYATRRSRTCPTRPCRYRCPTPST